MNAPALLQDLEDRFGLSTTQAAKLLGIDRRRHWEFRTGARELPPYIAASAEAHALLPAAKIRRLLDARHQ